MPRAAISNAPFAPDSRMNLPRFFTKNRNASSPTMTDPTAPDDAVTPEMLEAEPPAPDAPAESELDPLAQSQLESLQWKDAALRSAAELDNYRKRMAREMQEMAKFSNAGLLESLLPIIDNFDLGMQAAKQENEKSTLYVGLSMVQKQIQDFLRDQGVEELILKDSTFDPKLHDGMMQQPSDTVPEGMILYQTRKGYRLRDRLLRPASVVLSSGPAAPESPANS
jgi:molecular chaperone GrpE